MWNLSKIIWALGGIPSRRVAKGLAHVHHREADFAGFLRPQPGVELVQTGFRPIRAAKPDRPATLEIADDDAVRMSASDAALVHADHSRRWGLRASQLLGHVLLVERLD